MTKEDDVSVYLVDTDRAHPGGPVMSAGRPMDLRRQISHRVVRELCAPIMDVPPGSVELLHEANGNPFIPGGPFVSLSRRGRWAAIALSTSCPVGVDVELLRPYVDVTALVGDLFPQEVQGELMEARPEDRPLLFACWWARIEAAVKACGGSLDRAEEALTQTSQAVSVEVTNLGLAVAVPTGRSLAPSWHRLDLA